ncbi:MAG: carbohydrate ABC transporter permease, partial [Chloroflexota bacterium]|nr:carbohydrate ABC transporter permease [Chloroflexota bacterium]
MASTSLPGAAQRSPTQRRRRVQRIVQRVAAHAVLILLCTLFAVPFLWLLSTSLKPPAQLFKLPLEWIPRPFMWSNYARATSFIPFFLYLKNTLYITLFNVVATLISCSLAAYGFARIRWPGRDFLFVVLVATLMIPFPVTLIP